MTLAFLLLLDLLLLTASFLLLLFRKAADEITRDGTNFESALNPLF